MAHDPDIQDAYFDSILWVELGEKPENPLLNISDLVEILTGTRPGLATTNAAAAKLSEALGDRRILLIIDDTWREQDLSPFMQVGPVGISGGVVLAVINRNRRDLRRCGLDFREVRLQVGVDSRRRCRIGLMARGQVPNPPLPWPAGRARQKSLNRFGASAVWTAVLVIDRWPSHPSTAFVETDIAEADRETALRNFLRANIRMPSG